MTGSLFRLQILIDTGLRKNSIFKIMKRSYLICLFLAALSACMPPPSYINTAPKASMLSKKGDFQTTMAFGSQVNFNSKRFELATSFAPAKNFGVVADIATNGFNLKVNEFLSYNIGLVYFSETRPAFELLATFGQGRINAGDPNLGGPPPDYLITNLSRYKAFGSAKFERIMVQPSFSWRSKSDDNFKFYSGVRMQHLFFDEYFYVRENILPYENSFRLLLIDPFVQSSLQRGHLSIQTTLGYSLPLGVKKIDGLDHPNYGRMILSFGVGFHLGGK